MAGLVTAALTTRFVLPHLLPADLRLRDLEPFGRRLAILVARAHRLRWLVYLAFAVACGVLLGHSATACGIRNWPRSARCPRRIKRSTWRCVPDWARRT
jgi:predicted exporter